ncbi:MAG: phosphate ABC transporter permease PstA [Spirochaetia bacterium]
MQSISKRTRKSRRQERTAKTVIWVFAGLTIAILVWIIGYIMFRGFYYDKAPAYPVTYGVEKEVPLSSSAESEFVIITHRRVDAEDLTYPSLNTIYTKERRENWGFYTEQDIKVYPFAFKPGAGTGSRFADELADFILFEDQEYSKYTNYVQSAAEMLDKVRDTEGSIGVLPVEDARQLDLGRVNVVGLRRISVVVHPSVMEIVDNRKMQGLTEAQLKGIFLGETVNWKEAGGIDLPVRPVILPQDEGFLEKVTDIHFENEYTPPESVIEADSIDDFFRKISSTEGGVGIVFYKEAMEHESILVPVERRERGLNLTLSFLLSPPSRAGRWGGISYIIINTLLLILLTLIFSTPIGIAAAVYLIEYAKQGRLVNILRMGSETLAGIPSIVFGLFGHIFFVRILGFGIGFISATLTVTLMILPTIVRTAEEALKSVPMAYREGSLALGATKFQTIWKVVIPAASPGILTGVILAVGRVVGETAVLLYTLGSSYSLVSSLTSSARVLSLHLYLIFSEAISFERAFATGAVLVFIILIVNFATTRLIGRMNRMTGSK